MAPNQPIKIQPSNDEPENRSCSLFGLRVYCDYCTRDRGPAWSCRTRYPYWFTNPMAPAGYRQKQLPAMKTRTIDPESFEFYFSKLDTLVCVENRSNQVLIRATKATFSEAHKACFIRELAAEGFIPDDYQWFNEHSSYSVEPGIRWLVDRSWCKLNPAAIASARQFMVRTLVGGVLLWLLLIVSLFLGSAQRSLSIPEHQVSVIANHG